jgi:hypothetical protein
MWEDNSRDVFVVIHLYGRRRGRVVGIPARGVCHHLFGSHSLSSTHRRPCVSQPPTTSPWTSSLRPTLKSCGILYKDQGTSSGGTYICRSSNPHAEGCQAQIRHATSMPGDPTRPPTWPISSLQEPNHAQGPRHFAHVRVLHNTIPLAFLSFDRLTLLPTEFVFAM